MATASALPHRFHYTRNLLTVVEQRGMRQRLLTAIMRDFRRDRSDPKYVHETRFRGRLLRLPPGPVIGDLSDGFADSMLTRIGQWSRTGFLSQPFVEDGPGRYRASPGASGSGQTTLQVFLALTLLVGSSFNLKPQDEWFLIEEIFGSREHMHLTIGGPTAIADLTGILTNLLDYMYLALHGDYAVQIARWLAQIQCQPFERGLGRNSTPTQRAALDALWYMAEGRQKTAIVAKRRQDARAWIEEKPWPEPGGDGVHAIADAVPDWPVPPRGKRGTLGFHTSEFVSERLKKLGHILGGGEDRHGNSVFSIPRPAGSAGSKHAVVWLTAGSYPRGGRKSPSVTHGTTYGVDLDLDIHNAPRGREAEIARQIRRLRDLTQHFRQKGVDADFLGMRNVMKNESPLWTTEDFLPAVQFTQAILLTLPSRLYYGDLLVLTAAMGGVFERLDELRIARDAERTSEEPESSRTVGEDGVVSKLKPDICTHTNFEPTGHYNHWHVDWLDPDVLSLPTELAPETAYWPTPPRRWLLKGEANPLKDRSQLVRPNLIHGRDATRIPADSLDAIDGLLAYLGEDGAGKPALPIGDIENPDKVIEWLDKYYFVKDREPCARAIQ